MKIQDDIWHGNYRDTRTVDIEPTYDGWLGLINSGPYGQGDWKDNRYTRDAWERFQRTGESEFGWRRFRKV